MKTISVRPYKRSPRGLREKVLKQLVENHGLSKETAEKLIKLTTTQHALQSLAHFNYSWGVVRSGLKGSRFDPNWHNQMAAIFLFSLWGMVIDSDEEISERGWMEFYDYEVLRLYGLRLPANSKDVSLKILKGAQFLAGMYRICCS